MSEVGTHTEWVCPSLTVDNEAVPAQELLGPSDGLDEQAWSTAGTTGTSMSNVVPRASSWRRVSMINRGDHLAEVAPKKIKRIVPNWMGLRVGSREHREPGSTARFRSQVEIRVGNSLNSSYMLGKITTAALLRCS